MNPSLQRRMIGFLFVLSMAVAGCVDYAEPTGPVPVPEPDPGELTSVAVPADADVSAVRRLPTR